jgi:hypothetical protein
VRRCLDGRERLVFERPSFGKEMVTTCPELHHDRPKMVVWAPVGRCQT